MIELKVKKLHPDAIIPTYATDGSACFDLYATETKGSIDSSVGKFYPSVVVNTGLSFEIPAGYQMLVFSRSGHGFNCNVRLANCVGVVDSDYRGEVKVKLTADEDGYLQIKKGDRIAQAQLMPVHRVTFQEVSELTETERGAGGFGSTGK